MVTVIQEVGSIKLGAESYRLVRDDEARAWQEYFLDEPPWVEGVPPLLSEPQYTWHLGGLKSRQMVPGTSEYGQNTDTRFPFRLLPGPEITVITLPAGVGPPTCIFEAMSYIWVVASRYVYRVDPSDGSVVLSYDFGAGVRGVMGLRWETDSALVTTDAGEKSLWRVTLGAFQAGAFQMDTFQAHAIDGWEQSATVSAYRLAAGINRLFKVDKYGLLKNIVSGLDPMVEANWSGEVQCGSKDELPNGLLGFERTVLVGKAEGLFGVDIDGFGVPLIKRMVRDPENCLGMIIYEPHAIVPHSRGCFRYTPGLVESIGLERELTNESPVRGRFTAFVVDGQWLYGLLPVGSGVYVMAARPRRGDEAGSAPFIWDTWLYLPAASHAICALRGSAPRVWLGYGSNIAYLKLSEGGGAPDVEGSDYRFSLSGVRYSTRYWFGDQSDKDVPKFDIVGRNLTSNRYWDIYYSVDGGAYSKEDVGNSDMRIDSDGLKTFYLPTTAVGREVQFRFDYTGDVDTEAGEITYFCPYASPQSRKAPQIGIRLHLALGIRHDDGVEARSPIDQFNDLQTLVEQAAAVASIGPWGKPNVWVRGLQLVEALQEGGQEPEFVVDVRLQKREES